MLIAQITDIHIGFEPGNPDERNRERLERILAALEVLNPRPDLLFATGDLTEHGDAESYRWLRERLSRLPIPVHYGLGNHDVRSSFQAEFPEVPSADGFVQYAIDSGPVRCLMLDTLEEGRHGGAFCEVRARWLRERLAEEPKRPTLLIMHHPPAVVGLSWMDPHPGEPWIARLAAALSGHRNVVGLITGHVHRPVTLAWRNRMLTICPSVAPEVGLDLSPIDGDKPDGRPLIVDGEPGFALHRWTGDQLVTHFAAPTSPALARFTPALGPMIKGMAAERARAAGPRAA